MPGVFLGALYNVDHRRAPVSQYLASARDSPPRCRGLRDSLGEIARLVSPIHRASETGRSRRHRSRVITPQVTRVSPHSDAYLCLIIFPNQEHNRLFMCIEARISSIICPEERCARSPYLYTVARGSGWYTIVYVCVAGCSAGASLLGCSLRVWLNRLQD